MGGMADYYADMAWEAEAYEDYKDEYYRGIHYKDLLIKYLKGELKWKEKVIQDMDDNYLLNAIKWINKKENVSTVLNKFKDILLIEKYNRKLN